ncbi:mitochondrial sodium/calcium exchanger protein isoform X2 [Gadus chalcogrammus]|uniref:mitochondrial sodium/calcium exchanger protein isoform X2 n=1 Tax=Gadus chalcogrammus TaxID=1042646 RepID=UPI0024C4755F|nr:mitochondrial sodium/calcium exchanger protein isoform X2 [Gadus chalcogrammus]
MFRGSRDQCDLVMNLSAADRCAFVKSTEDCGLVDGFLSYLRLVFCLLPPNLSPLTVTLCMIWLLCLFVVLGLTASKFFCPNLSAISTTLRLTHNVAGVTFLALGNGAPDVFSAMAAFSHPHTAGLAVGALFGAGIFVTTVVAGGVALVKPFTVASRPFLRDVIFYMAAVFWTYLILYRGTIELGETLGYLSLYAIYVLTVIISAYIYNRQKHSPHTTIQNGSSTLPDPVSSVSDAEVLSSSTVSGDPEFEEEYRPLLPYSESTSHILLSSLNPVDLRKWRRSSWRWRLLKALRVPLEVLLLLCIPVVDPDKEDRNWRRPLNCLHLVTAPLVCVLTFQSGAYGTYLIQGQFPVWLLALLPGVLLAAIMYCTTANDRPPPYHSLLALLGFVVSAVLISAVASEVVSLLHMLGVVLSLSNTVLGLTVLAWGNSIGDMLFGVGLGCLVRIFQTHNAVQLEPAGLLTWVLAGSLGLSLVLSFVIVPLCRFHLSRAYGMFLLLFYAAFLTVALLTEFGTIHLT